jgi:hypothetical protein
MVAWAPNPIALARTLLGGTATGCAWPRSWRETEELLGHAYQADAQTVFRTTGATRAVIDLLRDVAASVPAPSSLDRILALPAGQALAARVRKPDALARLLPFVAPVEGARFAPPGTGFALLDHPPPIGTYARIGALDVAGVSWLDPEQGNVADCYLISAMIAIAWARPATWLARLSAATGGSKETDTLRVAFHDESETAADPPAFDVPPRVPLDAGRNWIYAHSAQSEETWPALLERAYVMQRCNRTAGEPTVDDYRAIGDDGRNPHDAARMLVGGTPRSRFAPSPAAAAAGHSLYKDLRPICADSLANHPTMAWTGASVGPGLVAHHSYAVLGLLEDGDERFVVLRNPYGTNEPVAGFAAGEWASGAPRNGGDPVALDENGVFALDAPTFDACFAAFGWIELAPDSDAG